MRVMEHLEALSELLVVGGWRQVAEARWVIRRRAGGIPVEGLGALARPSPSWTLLGWEEFSGKVSARALPTPVIVGGCQKQNEEGPDDWRIEFGSVRVRLLLSLW